MIKLEYIQYLKNGLNYYYQTHEPSILVNVFMCLAEYSGDNDMLPNIAVPKLFEYSYELDDNDLRLAYKEFTTFPSSKSVENMILVIIMLYKGFGLTFEDFKKEIIKNLTERIDNP